MSAKILGPIGVRALENRGIDPERAAQYDLYTGRPGIDGGIIPDAKGNVVVFPFIDGGVVVSEKYRGPEKKFWQMKGGKRTFWNADIMDDPALTRGDQALIITEGEIDALTAITCGFPFTVSVPDGAPPPPANGDGNQSRSPQSDEGGKFEFMWSNFDRLKKIKRFIIATDSDAPGKHLATELVRRINPARCYFVTYPEGCKDLSDVMQRDGAAAVTAVLNGARPYPVKDLHRLDEYIEAPAVKTLLTGWDTVDELMQLFTPSLMVVTGIPSHGKSSWVTNLLMNAAEMHGWKSAIYSPEMPVVPHLRDKMRRIRGRKALDHMTRQQMESADQFITENFVFIEHLTDEDDLTLEWLIGRAEEAVLRYGVKFFVIDPWNEVEHAKRKDETMSEYISRGLRMLKRFQVRYDCCVIVVAHPTKDVGAGGKPRVPTLYDIDGSAAFFNKPDIGIVIDRPDPMVNESMVHVVKVRFDGTGSKGSVRMKFDRETSRYELLDGRSEAKGHYGKPR